MFVIWTSDWFIWTPACRIWTADKRWSEHSAYFPQQPQQVWLVEVKTEQQAPVTSLQLCFTVLSTRCLCGLCKNNHLSIISKKLALWQTNYSSGFHPLAQEEADYTFIFVVSWPQLGTRYLPKPLYHSPPWLDRERKYNSNLVGERRGRDHSPITILNETDSTYRKINSLTIKLE